MSSHSSALQLANMLENVLAWLDKAEAHAKEKKFDFDAFVLHTRLAPDQFPLMKQLQAAADGAKFCAARLAGKDPPKHADTETKVDEIRQRLRSVIEYVRGFAEADFAGSDTRMIPLGFAPGKGLIGADYRDRFVVPNFYFHVTTAYAILRHNGVTLGKTDFLGNAPLRDLPPA
jgi:hypothetical protein